MSEREHPSTVRRSVTGLPLPIATVGVSSEITYADPHLVVLLFLLGFCLLYVLVVVVDAFSRSDRRVDEDVEWASERT